MLLIDAINEVAKGHAVVSVIGKRYTDAELAPVWVGEHYASFNRAGMTATEIKGEWRIDNE